jgi:hypothetical protein
MHFITPHRMCELDSSCSKYVTLVGSCEHGYKPTGSIKIQDFFSVNKQPLTSQKRSCSINLYLFILYLLMMSAAQTEWHQITHL